LRINNVCSAYYQAPERISRSRYGLSADCWSIGLTLLATYIGGNPIDYFFRGDVDVKKSYWELHRVICEEDMHDAIPSEMPDELQDLISLCLTKDASLRSPVTELLQHEFFYESTGVSSCERLAIEEVLEIDSDVTNDSNTLERIAEGSECGDDDVSCGSTQMHQFKCTSSSANSIMTTAATTTLAPTASGNHRPSVSVSVLAQENSESHKNTGGSLDFNGHSDLSDASYDEEMCEDSAVAEVRVRHLQQVYIAINKRFDEMRERTIEGMTFSGAIPSMAEFSKWQHLAAQLHLSVEEVMSRAHNTLRSDYIR
jgi:serine/threonine protein kinase